MSLTSSRPGRRTTLAAGVAAIALAIVPSAGAKPLGVQLDSVTGARAGSDVAAAATTGGNAVRVEADWSLLEPYAHGAYDPAYEAALDRTVDAAAARGLKVLLFVDRSPCWASSAPQRGDCAAPGANTFDVTRYGPKDPQDYVSVATHLAARYGDKLGAFEVWNEPDQSNEKYWAGPDKVKRYVALTQAVYGPLKQASPNLPVLAGSFVGTDGAWLKAMYAAGVQGSYDGLAVHFYDLPLSALKSTRAVQRAHGDTKPLWLTEFGWTSCLRAGGPTFRGDHPCTSKTAQARGLSDIFRAVAKTSWIAGATMYALRDQTANYQFGLFDQRGGRKPSFTAVRGVLRAPRSGAVTRPSLRLRRSGRHVAASGSGSVADVYQVNVYQGTTLRYRVNLRTTGTGSYQVALPAVLGTSGLKVRISSLWSPGTATTRSN